MQHTVQRPDYQDGTLCRFDPLKSGIKHKYSKLICRFCTICPVYKVQTFPFLCQLIVEDRDLNLDLKEISKDIRCNVLSSIAHLGVGHLGGSLLIVDLLTVLSFKLKISTPKTHI